MKTKNQITQTNIKELKNVLDNKEFINTIGKKTPKISQKEFEKIANLIDEKKPKASPKEIKEFMSIIEEKIPKVIAPFIAFAIDKNLLYEVGRNIALMAVKKNPDYMRQKGNRGGIIYISRILIWVHGAFLRETAKQLNISAKKFTNIIRLINEDKINKKQALELIRIEQDRRINRPTPEERAISKERMRKESKIDKVANKWGLKKETIQNVINRNIEKDTPLYDTYNKFKEVEIVLFEKYIDRKTNNELIEEFSKYTNKEVSRQSINARIRKIIRRLQKVDLETKQNSENNEKTKPRVMENRKIKPTKVVTKSKEDKLKDKQKMDSKNKKKTLVNTKPSKNSKKAVIKSLGEKTNKTSTEISKKSSKNSKAPIGKKEDSKIKQVTKKKDAGKKSIVKSKSGKVTEKISEKTKNDIKKINSEKTTPKTIDKSTINIKPNKVSIKSDEVPGKSKKDKVETKTLKNNKKKQIVKNKKDTEKKKEPTQNFSKQKPTKIKKEKDNKEKVLNNTKKPTKQKVANKKIVKKQAKKPIIESNPQNDKKKKTKKK